MTARCLLYRYSFQIKLFCGLTLLLLLTIFGVATQRLVSQHDQNRSLRYSSNSKPSVYKGNVTLDFYRTFEDKTFLGIIPYKAYSMSRPRIAVQVAWMNFWYEGRVDFYLGDIYEVEDAFYSNPELVCTDALDRFASTFGQEDRTIKNVHRINVLVVPQLARNTNGCATVDVPLGGCCLYKAPAFVLTRDNDGLATTGSLGSLGSQNFFGYVASHEVGHVFGLRHTAETDEAAPRGISYFSCGLNLRYPQFSVFDDPIAHPDLKFWDMVTGELYTYTDWHAQSNFMTSTCNLGLGIVWKVGIFRYKYEPIFDAILECWFSRSNSRDDDIIRELP
ncbi:unknown protein [Seminavis robusta]|uniref:Uncharacterized protein n=1 Tax=Seminavis robusta TaxID=568900 RepID=A0A9N8E1W4_9STRA|nr:unknown protein [Seminavis robusta]|eukprot:Sro534_g161840.1 n/a (334) ;mRNA; r:59406-60407